jgi:predicted aminopeptidase
MGLLAYFTLCGCQITHQISYLAANGAEQIKLFFRRVPVEEVIADPTTPPHIRSRLVLAQEVLTFARSIGLTTKSQYTKFVQLDRDYLTYVVSAAPKWEMMSYKWDYPFIGELPYRGYYDLPKAEAEERELQLQGLDTYLRGVSAFSMLGWISDPIYSSMLKSSEEDFVNTLLHELVHATVFLKSQGDFNENLASFIAQVATEKFYEQRLHGGQDKLISPNESPNLSSIRQRIIDANNDETVFTNFINKEIEGLDKWYKEVHESEKKEDLRQQKLAEILQRFKTKIKPVLRTNLYDRFMNARINNARLLIYKTYGKDLDLLEKAFKKHNENFLSFIDYCKQLESSHDPVADVRAFVNESHP